jgi:hypothetical protein
VYQRSWEAAVVLGGSMYLEQQQFAWVGTTSRMQQQAWSTAVSVSAERQRSRWMTDRCRQHIGVGGTAGGKRSGCLIYDIAQLKCLRISVCGSYCTVSLSITVGERWGKMECVVLREWGVYVLLWCGEGRAYPGCPFRNQGGGWMRKRCCGEQQTSRYDLLSLPLPPASTQKMSRASPRVVFPPAPLLLSSLHRLFPTSLPPS